MPRRKLARIGDRISFRTLGGLVEGTVAEIHSDYLYVDLDEPRAPYEHEIAISRLEASLGRMEPDLMRDTVNRHGEYTITRYVEETR